MSATVTFANTALFQTMFAVVVIVGSHLARQDLISVGSIVAFLLYLIQIIMLFGSLNMVLTTMFKVTGAAQKIKDILTYNPKVPYE
jgi:ABC-type multidrug transport system fused ATPase/permease subunit